MCAREDPGARSLPVSISPSLSRPVGEIFQRLFRVDWRGPRFAVQVDEGAVAGLREYALTYRLAIRMENAARG